MLSKKWQKWNTIVTLLTCKPCKEENGRIYHINTSPFLLPPKHPNCHCFMTLLSAVFAGETTKGILGADWWVKYFGRLPDYYISRKEAESKGWNSKIGNLSEVLPGKMIGGEIFKNREGLLPEQPGRIWYEADLDYTIGFRNSRRLLYSNDGLLFITKDHYYNFIEVI